MSELATPDLASEQTAAEPGQTAAQPPETATTEAPAEQSAETKEPEKRFTQEELDRQIRLRVAREQRKYERRLGELEARVHTPQPQAQSQSAAEPKLDAFPDYESYQRALIRHEAEKLVAEREQRHQSQASQAEQQRRMADLSRQFEAREDAAREQIEDYDDVVGLLRPGALPPHAVEVIGESDMGPQLLYKLASEPKLVAEIARLSPAAAARRLVKLEAEIEKPKPKSQAPEPVRPLSGRAADASDMPSDKDDIDTWLRKERARMEKMGRR